MRTPCARPGTRFGPLLGDLVISELARRLSWSHELAELYHYRDHGKVEVDAVLENRHGQVVGVEVKAASTVRSEDFNGLRRLASKLGGDFLVGVVLYTGTTTLPFGPKLRAMSVPVLTTVIVTAPARPGRPRGIVMCQLMSADVNVRTAPDA